MYEFHSSECLTDWATCGLLNMPARRRGEERRGGTGEGEQERRGEVNSERIGGSKKNMGGDGAEKNVERKG